MVERCRKWTERHVGRGDLSWHFLMTRGIPIGEKALFGVK